MSKRIALFGGSFNPPHVGHREIAKRLARRKTIDEVWILPVYRHPFGKELADFSLRKKICRTLFGNLSKKIKIKDTEKRLGGTSWTFRLVNYFKKKHPNHQFYFVMGSDDFRQRKRWKNFDQIEKNVEFIVFPRGKKSFIPNISSTELRSQGYYEKHF